MTFPKEDLSAVDEAAHAVVLAAQKAGVWVFGGGVTAFPPGSTYLKGPRRGRSVVSEGGLEPPCP